jgi:hypothetical protein
MKEVVDTVATVGAHHREVLGLSVLADNVADVTVSSARAHWAHNKQGSKRSYLSYLARWIFEDTRTLS